MTKVYVHLSGKDAEEAVLALHGITPQDSSGQSNTDTISVLGTKQCPRCSEQNTPEVPRCIQCGFILDEQLLAKTVQQTGEGDSVTDDLLERLEKVEKIGSKVDLILNQLVGQKPVQMPNNNTLDTKKEKSRRHKI